MFALPALARSVVRWPAVAAVVGAGCLGLNPSGPAVAGPASPSHHVPGYTQVNLVADRAYDLVDPGDFLRALGNGEAGFEPLGPIGAAGDDRLGCHQQAGAGDDALVDRLFEPDVGEACALGAEIALGREAGFERDASVDHGACRAKR